MIDDEPHMTRVLHTTLQSESSGISAAESGLDVHARFDAEKPKRITTDLAMRGRHRPDEGARA